jgi:PAS domain S-box-containing protein
VVDGAACSVCGTQSQTEPCEDCAAQAVLTAPRRSADDRDRAAELRDRGADDRDAAARRNEQSDGNRGSERDRRKSAEDRGEAAEDRQEAARERGEALSDRVEAGAAAERALAILESMSDAFFTLDADWRFTYLNPQTEGILDRSREDLLGQNMWEEFPELAGTGFEAAYRRAHEEQVTVRFEADYEPLRRTLEIRVYPVLDGLAVYFSDVTSERRRDAEQRQTQRLEVLGRVTAGVAHDFNNLLTAIGGFARLGQLKSDTDGKDAYYFEQIIAASETATALTRQLLTIGREQALSPVLVDLNEIVKGVFSLLRQLMPSGIELRLALSAEPVVVFADRSQLEQVLINLVVNSRDAIDSTGSVTLSTTAVEPEGVIHDRLVPSGWLQVTDTGTGIADDVLPRIFDPYYSTKKPEFGTGLGLATIYGIISQSGGAIYVNTTVDAGTTMSVAIPSAPS